MIKVVYITGCLGFIGSHLTRKCLSLGWYVIGVDKVTYASNEFLINEFLNYSNFKFIKEDICDLDRLYDCDYIINAAAETHVDNSIEGSDEFVHSNIDGVHHLLKLIAKRKNRPSLLHFSTDEVYGDIVEGSHIEDHPLKPSNPYSATKAAADMLITAWGRTHEVPYIIVRPTNNYGIGQYVEKLIPKTIKHFMLDRKVPLHERGTPRRTWLHVNDTVEAILKITEKGSLNNIYNISGNYEERNIEVVKKIIDIYYGHDVKYEDHIDFNYTRPGQDVRYSIDDAKLKLLGWSAEANFNKELQSIVKYYKHVFIW